MSFELSNLLDRALTRITQFFAEFEPPQIPASLHPSHLAETFGFDTLSLPAEITDLTQSFDPEALFATPFVSQLGSFIASPQLAPYLPVAWGIVVLCAFFIVLRAPHPFRGPRIPLRDSQRGYKIALRNEIMQSAGYRCESPRLFAWGRCTATATQVDHIYPWSRGGPTTRTNGQALCANHNRKKNDKKPPWWYVLSLERRRRIYYPVGAVIRVQAYPRRKMSRRKRFR